MSSDTLILSNISNTHQLGLVMYAEYILYFQLAGIVSTRDDWAILLVRKSRRKTKLYKSSFQKSIDSSRTYRG